MTLTQRIQNKDITLGIIGPGNVGLPLAVAFAKAGFPVAGIDIDEEKVENINAGRNCIPHVDEDLVQDLVIAGNPSATTDYTVIRKKDAAAICVPTPMKKLKNADDQRNTIQTQCKKALCLKQ